jgi:hypothetical protein
LGNILQELFVAQTFPLKALFLVERTLCSDGEARLRQALGCTVYASKSKEKTD